jgi:hypothetical protein
VSIATGHCDPGLADDVGRIAAIELHAMRVPPAEEGADVTRIDVECDGDEVALRVADPLTSKEVTRRVSITGVELRARARTIALAVAELVSASWVELETTPEPKVEPIPKRVPPRDLPRASPRAHARPREPSAPPTPPVVFQAVAGARVFFDSRELLLGGGLVVEPWLTRSVLLRFDGFVEHGSGTRVPGDVTVDTMSTAAGIGLGMRASALRLTTTLGVRAGYARLVGLSRVSGLQGAALDGAWVGPEVSLGLELFPRAHVHAVASATLGWAIAGVIGPVPGDRDVLARGPHGALTIGFAAN